MRISAVILASCLFVGCGDDPAAIDPQKIVDEEGKAKVAALFSSLSEGYCDYLYRCCNTNELEFKFETTFSDKQSCQRYFDLTDEETNYGYQVAVADGDLSLDGNAETRCLKDWSNQTCGDVEVDAFVRPRGPESCDPQELFIGRKDAGRTCRTSYECDEGLSCRAGGNGEGMCLPLRRLGDPCTSDSLCLSGLVCANPAEGLRSCQSPATEGTSCEELACDPSDEDLYCASEENETTGIIRKVCKRKLGPENECTKDADCRQGLWCNYLVVSSDGLCADKLADGKSCEVHAQCTSGKCDSTTKRCGESTPDNFAACNGMTVGL